MKRKSKQLVFNSYRFQIVPTSKNVQISFDPIKIDNISDLIKQKNNIFELLLNEGNILKFCKQEFTCRLDSHKDNIYIFRVGFKRQIERTKKDFRKERIEDWPNVLIILNNDPNVQKILIQHNARLTQDTTTVINKIWQSANDFLRPYQLHISIEPLFEKKEFWRLVKENWNRITVCDFELFSPNLANISGKISDQIKELLRNSNSIKSHVKLESDSDSSLDLSENDPQLAGLVDYTAEGGGNIRVKIRGFSKYKSTAKNVKTITIEEMEIKVQSLEDLKKILPGLFD